MLSQQDKKLENMQRCIYAILHKKTDLKSARQNLQVLRGVFRHIHFFKASFRIKFQFVLHDTCLSLSLKKKKNQKHPISVKQGISVPGMRLSVVTRPSFFYSCGLWFWDVLIICLVLQFFPEVVNCFV